MLHFRKAVEEDLPAIAAIYDAILTDEEAGKTVIGWKRGVYPTADTARGALDAGDLFVLEKDGVIAASARLNHIQVPEYAMADWACDAPDEKIFVLHTLTVDPALAGQGLGSAFVEFYEKTAREKGCTCLRMDTNERNAAARRLYAHLGYREAGIVPCCFNGIEGVRLVCLEKLL